MSAEDNTVKSIPMICEDLEYASSMCSSELGEWWQNLISVYPRLIDLASEEFQKIWETQLREEYARLKEEFRIRNEKAVQEVNHCNLLHFSECDEDEWEELSPW